MEITAGKSTELPRDIQMDTFALLEITDLVRGGSVFLGTPYTHVRSVYICFAW
jgi:hypothetical protein